MSLRPSIPPTLADLYLAFRQAKTALYFEKRGVGLLEFAEYEQKLPDNLRALQAKLSKGRWFDKLKLGEVWLVPKRLRPSEDADDGVVRIGAARHRTAGRPIDIQLRLSPHPEFAIAEVLYLWQFGGLLDSLLSKKEVLGYRLDLRKHQVVPHRRWLFEYWPKRYQQFRTDPLVAAKSALERGDQTLIISGDLATFYDTISPSFMLEPPIVSGLVEHGASLSEIDSYKSATASLLRAYARFRAEATRRSASPIALGVPIGALTSRVVANLALIPLDSHIGSRPGVLCYRRYVDDLVIVAKSTDADHGLVAAMRRFMPLVDGAADDLLRLDVTELSRRGSEFQLQKAKVRVHLLAGVPGVDFVEAVTSDFAKLVSERRAFVDSSTLVGDGVTHLIRAGESEGSPLRVLRDADRARLERFALSTSLHSLERVSSLIGHDEARELVRGSLERVGRVLDAEDNWVADLDVSLRLLKLAISTGDWESATELRQRMDRVWGTADALRSATSRLYYRGREIRPGKKSPWTWLRNYLHARRLEAIISALPIGMDADQIESRIPHGLVVRTKRVGATMLRRRAEQLAAADLRARDREDDARSSDPPVVDREWLRSDVKADAELSARLAAIDTFVQRCEELDDRPWLMPAARLFLCTRPPSYFDIARRWLYRVEESGFDDDVFDSLLSVVNAVRGTAYNDAVGRVIDRSTVSIEPPWENELLWKEPPDPRIILGNLVVEDAAWKGAATRVEGTPFGQPLLTKERLEGLNEILGKAARVARRASVLVLPELSVPRRWFRTVANHVVKNSQYGLVLGLEYRHSASQPYVANQVFAVLPGPRMSVAAWPWTKRLPSREEGNQLSRLPSPVSFRPPPATPIARTVVRSAWGDLSVLICSELIEARRVADLLGRANVVLCPAWNTDTASYDHLIQSVGFQLHAFIAIANNGHYSDSRAWAPRTERWERDLCRLIERDVNDVVYVDVPLTSLVDAHQGKLPSNGKYDQLRDALQNKDLKAARKALNKLIQAQPGPWRPLPPDWS
jgi:hypothetical protein